LVEASNKSQRLEADMIRGLRSRC